MYHKIHFISDSSGLLLLLRLACFELVLPRSRLRSLLVLSTSTPTYPCLLFLPLQFRIKRAAPIRWQACALSKTLRDSQLFLNVLYLNPEETSSGVTDLSSFI